MNIPARPVDLAACRALVDDLRAPNPKRYFVDATLSGVVGWWAYGAAVATSSLPMAALWITVSCLAMFRVLAFIHELFHQQQMHWFRGHWHVIAGIPLLLPLLLYLPVHQAHHSSRAYGTLQDGEYEQFAGRAYSTVTKLLALNLLIPLALVIRFGLLTPLSFAVPWVRNELIPRFLHLSLRVPFKVSETSGKWQREHRFIEIACMFVAWALCVLAAGTHSRVAIVWAVLIVGIAMLNTLRAAGATHLYDEHPGGRNAVEQMKDSLNVEGNTLSTWLLCPVGLQYHALHHLAPYVPYHHLEEAHRRLMARLPESSDYRRATVNSVWKGWNRVATTMPVCDRLLAVGTLDVASTLQPELDNGQVPPRREEATSARG